MWDANCPFFPRIHPRFAGSCRQARKFLTSSRAEGKNDSAESDAMAASFTLIEDDSLEYLRELILYNSEETEKTEEEFDEHAGLKDREDPRLFQQSDFGSESGRAWGSASSRGFFARNNAIDFARSCPYNLPQWKKTVPICGMGEART